MGLLDKVTLRIIATVLVVAAVMGFIWLARKPLLAFLFAMLFAYLLEPLITFVQTRFKASRGIAIGAVYAILLVVLVALGLVFGPRIADEGRKLAQTAPELYNKVASGNIAWQLGQARGWSYETQLHVQQFIAGHREQVLAVISEQSAKVTALAGNVLWIVLVPILAIFFLKDKSQFGRDLADMIDNVRTRELFRNILSDLDEMLAHFVRAQLYLAAISGAVYIGALSALKVPYSLVLGTIAGFLEFIPVVGPLVAAVLIVAICFALNYPHLLLVIIFLGVWRGLQDYVVSPRILGGRVELHPLASIFGVLAGGEVGGVVGVYFAIPLMATIRILWHRWKLRDRGETIEVRHQSTPVVRR